MIGTVCSLVPERFLQNDMIKIDWFIFIGVDEVGAAVEVEAHQIVIHGVVTRATSVGRTGRIK